MQYLLKYMLILESSLMNWKFKYCLKRAPTEFIDLLLRVWHERSPRINLEIKSYSKHFRSWNFMQPSLNTVGGFSCVPQAENV